MPKTGKIREKPWLCAFTSTVCQVEAKKHCPACDRILCDQCFTVHKLRGCPIYTGTDQCLCIWEPPAKWPACGCDIRGPEGPQGHVGIQDMGGA